MLLFMLFFALFQAESHHGEDGFIPIPSGAGIQIGAFDLTVPNGVLLAPEEHAFMMMPLAGSRNIPLCKGVYYSASATWDYGVAIQSIDGFHALFEPTISTDIWEKNLKAFHFYTGQPYQGKVEIIEPPNFDPATNSFSLAVVYYEGEYAGYYKKKLWSSSNSIMILSAKIQISSLSAKLAEVDQCFAQVVPHEEASGPQAPGSEAMSYLEVLGINLTQATNMVQNPNLDQEEQPNMAIILMISGLLLTFAAGLLFTAFKLRKKTEAAKS